MSYDRFAGPELSVLSLLFPDLQSPAIIPIMESIKYIYWQDQDHWLGYLQDYPDYWTQGESFEDLQAHLWDLDGALSTGDVLSSVR